MEHEASPYGSRTYRSSNYLRRFAHSSRFGICVDLVVKHCRPNGKVLDYGCGDGHFLNLLPRNLRAVGYDPMPNKTLVSEATIYRTISNISEKFDCITCFEVMEHLDNSQQEEVFSDAKRLLESGGTIIFSVPVMIGPAGFIKSFLESIFSNKPGYSVKNSLLCLAGSPPRNRPLDKTGLYQHMGFDHRVFSKKLREKFSTVLEMYSPFKSLPSGLNSQAIFVCKY